MLNPDIIIINGVKTIGALVKKTIITPLSVTIGGIPINAICLLILLFCLIETWYKIDKNNQGEMYTKINAMISTSKFTKWITIGAFALIGVILAI